MTNKPKDVTKPKRKKAKTQTYEEFDFRSSYSSASTYAIEIRTLPPSTNALYQWVPLGKSKRWTQILTPSARNWKIAFNSAFSKSFGPFLHKITTLDESVLFKSQTVIFGPFVINKGFPNKAASLVKTMDLDNRLKFIQDCFTKALGINDSKIFSMKANKLYMPDIMGATVLLSISDQHFGIPKKLLKEAAKQQIVLLKEPAVPDKRGL